MEKTSFPLPKNKAVAAVAPSHLDLTVPGFWQTVGLWLPLLLVLLCVGPWLETTPGQEAGQLCVSTFLETCDW